MDAGTPLVVGLRQECVEDRRTCNVAVRINVFLLLFTTKSRRRIVARVFTAGLRPEPQSRSEDSSTEADLEMKELTDALP
jgi:hypothetical protein